MTGTRHPARFKTTRWTLVLAAGDRRTASTDDALAALYETYWYPLYAFLRGRGHDPEHAMDLLQSFFVHVLEKGSLRRADPARGRFRTFLLTSLKNFAENERQRLSARKRGGGVPLLSLELQDAERRFQIDPPTFETPERLFDRQWALALLDRVMHRLQAELPANRARAFEHLRPYLTGEEPAPSYAQTAALFGSSESALKVAVHRLRRRFRDLVHEEIAHTVSGPDEIARELKHLWSAVRR